MKLIVIMKVSMIMIWYEMLMHWLVVYMCHTLPSSIFLWISCWDCLENPLKASVPESRRVVEGISRDLRDHRSFGQSVDGRSDGECWTEPQFLQVFWYQAFVLEFFFPQSYHVMSTESWCKVEEGIQVPLQGISYASKRWVLGSELQQER